ncbi:class I SAM-dependent methyltransferase [Rheinheimera sp. SA_1]|uniref:class I SAM-dependent methyltransferase n=1 Tax=Rheinheimera sp. SA_1 TaxID=1827365 RepID=UPI000B1BEF45|nr:class I SAM-dependent methyltransferase [Rheinheimera sp. SA_1]
MTIDDKKMFWEQSYLNHDNFMFYPHEEIIRFTAKYIAKRTGLEQVEWRCKSDAKVLDLGCGIGRHVVFVAKMGIDICGIDLSETAIAVAKTWLEKENLGNQAKLQCADIRFQPWPDQEFDFVMSHGVLDSMPFDVACAAVKETARVCKPGALFYCDLISSEDSWHGPDYCGEEVVQTSHEFGTIQSYFNPEKISQLFTPFFTILETTLIKRMDTKSGQFHSRFHLILQRCN